MLKDDDARAMVEAEVPVGRVGNPDDMAGLAIFLSSKAGAYLTGVTIPLGGGIATAD